ncbi:MAG: hypoxanthine phosphoribosyltransferase [Bryobacteraceae bacterium]|jgi:hypoxanthine phosphoribosyltransferase
MAQARFDLLLSAETIAQRVAELGDQISTDYGERPLVLIGVLKGSFMFMADLIRHIRCPVRIEFIGTKSYAGTSTSGEVQLTKDLDKPIEGEDVLLVEDIVDTGLTLNYLRQMLAQRGPASLRTVAFLDKPTRRRIEVHADYVGFVIEDRFVVGYGLDFEQKYRHLKDVCVLIP